MSRADWSHPEKRKRRIRLFRVLNPDIDPRLVQLMDELRQVSHAIYQLGESSLAEAGLSYARYRLLMGLMFSEEIEERGALNPSEISERQGTSRNTISALIRDLEGEGLVERQLDESDRRKFKILLTENGRHLVRNHAGRHLHTVAQCFEALTPAEQDTLRELLAKLRAGVDQLNS